ncbi:MAG: hypothetical protein M3Q22_00485 [Actinomycetota bacterium]|nr:hypothetical protein [Actinomycetota bacterium]
MVSRSSGVGHGITLKLLYISDVSALTGPYRPDWASRVISSTGGSKHLV